MEFSPDGEDLIVSALCTDPVCGDLIASSNLYHYNISSGDLFPLVDPQIGLLKWKPHFGADGAFYYGITEMHGKSLSMSHGLGHAVVVRMDLETGAQELVFPPEATVRLKPKDSRYRPGLHSVDSPGFNLGLLKILRMDGDEGLLHASPRSYLFSGPFERNQPIEKLYIKVPTDPRTHPFVVSLCEYSIRVEAISPLNEGGEPFIKGCVPAQPSGNIIRFDANEIALVDAPIEEAAYATDGILNMGEEPAFYAAPYADGHKIALIYNLVGRRAVTMWVLEDGAVREWPELASKTGYASRLTLSDDGQVMIFLDTYRPTPEYFAPEMWLWRDQTYARILDITIVED